MSVKKFVGGLIFGGGVAGVLSLLANPNNGKENLEKIKEFIEEVKEEAARGGSNVEVIQEKSKEIKELIDTTVKPAVTDIQQSVKDFQFQANPRIEQLKADIETTKSHLPQSK